MTNQTTQKEFVITRVFNAPRKLVYDAWTKTEHMQHWLAPKGFKVEHPKADFRPGGTVHYKMTGPDGNSMWGKAIYKELKTNEKLVYEQFFSDEKGGITRHPASATWPLSMLTTIIFEDEGNKTKITLTWVPVDATAEEAATFQGAMDGMKQGWTGSFEQLDAYLLQINK